MNEVAIEMKVTTELDPEDVRVLEEGLERFNEESFIGAGRRKLPIAVWLRRDGLVLGGAVGDTHYGWLYLNLLWVDETLRGQDWGRRLVHRFETEGAARGCHGAWVDTYQFQAPGFYEKVGYREFGRLEDFPVGSARLFYWKPLAPS